MEFWPIFSFSSPVGYNKITSFIFEIRGILRKCIIYLCWIGRRILFEGKLLRTSILPSGRDYF